MQDTKRIFMAALCGITNIGLPVPETRDLRIVRQLISDGKYTLGDAVDHFASGYYENDDHQKTFRGEAHAWYDRNMKTADYLPKFNKAWKDSFAKRWETALQINEGAVNLIPIATAIADATRECNDERGINSHEDAAVRIMAHQLAHLTQVGAVMDLGDYQRCIDKCTDEANAIKALRDDPETV